MRVAVVPALLVAVALAGCTGDGEAPDAITDSDNGSDDVDLDPGVPMIQVEDPWLPDETERVLFDDVVEVSGAGCAPGQLPTEVWVGCADAYLPDGVLLPQGTLELHVEADASQADRYGPWSAYLLRTHGRLWSYGDAEMEGEPTTAETGSWTFALEATDWDPPDVDVSRLIVHFMGHGDRVNVLQGDVAAVITAVRDPDWMPPAYPDPWQDPANHTYTPEGSMVLHWSNETYDWQGNVQGGTQGGGNQDIWVMLSNLVPLGATHITVGVQTASFTACSPGHDCYVNFRWATAHANAAQFGDAGDPEYGSDYAFRVFDTPDLVLPDPHDAEGSGSFLELYLTACDPVRETVGGRGQCEFESLDADFEASVLVEAWREAPDVGAFKQRLGVA